MAPLLLTDVHPLYRGYRIRYELTPIPDRQFDWTAVDDDSDGLVVASGPTLQDCRAEVDRYVEEQLDG